jgi:hypothetical protein
LLAAAVGIGNCWQIENLGKSFARNRWELFPSAQVFLCTKSLTHPVAHVYNPVKEKKKDDGKYK